MRVCPWSVAAVFIVLGFSIDIVVLIICDNTGALAHCQRIILCNMRV